LSEYPQTFSRLCVSLVRAGETGGMLADALTQLADHLERESRLNATIRSALTYPALLLFASTVTIFLLLTFVLPKFTAIFAQAGAKLPAATRVLIAIGESIRDDGGWALVALLCLGLVAQRSLREPGIRIAAERCVLVLPVVGGLIRRSQAARLARTLGTLLRNGVSLVLALSISQDVLGNLIAARAVQQAATKVKAGERLASALAEGQFFPAQTIHLLRLGEETGKLGEMALRAANIHDDQVQQTVQRMVALLVPVVTIVMGLVVAGIVGSLLAAMLSLNDLAL
jgi:general secretion pathway protein F